MKELICPENPEKLWIAVTIEGRAEFLRKPLIVVWSAANDILELHFEGLWSLWTCQWCQ